jgi:CheY-like chemotaxis protein
VEIAADGEAGLAAVTASDLVVVDLMRPSDAAADGSDATNPGA